MSKPSVNPYLAVFLAVIAVSFSSLFVKLSTANSFIIAFYRLFLTFLILVPFSFKQKMQDIVALHPRDVALSALSGAFLAFHFISWFVSLKFTSVASSVVLVTTQPIFVVLGSFVLFREKINSKAVVGGAIALLGSIMIGAGDFKYGGTALLGDFLAIVGAIAISAYLIIGRQARSRTSLGAYTFITYGSASVILAVVSLSTHQSFYPYPLNQWALFMGLAFVCTVLGHTVFNWALKYVKASVIAVGVLGEPVGAIVWASIFLGENPTPRQVLSGFVIMVGLYIFTRANSAETEHKLENYAE